MHFLSIRKRRRACFPFCIFLFLIGSFAVLAQEPAANQTGAAQPQPPSLIAVFENKIDSKSARVGDSVVAKTSRDLKLSDLVIPKGSKLQGAITSVKPAGSGSDDSMLGVRFDR